MKNLLLHILVSIPAFVYSQVGIGTTQPDTNAVLDVYSVSKGVLLPRLTKTQCKAIKNPPSGLIVYVIDAYVEYFYINGLCFPFFEGRLWIYTGRFWAEVSVIVKY